MIIGVPKELHPEERRVAATPRTVKRLCELGFEVLLESDAGLSAEHWDAAYIQSGGECVPSAEEVWSRSDIVIKVREPQLDEADMLREGGVLIGFIWPAQNVELVDRLAARGATVLAMDCIPRISRAQKMDALSAMANAAGYRAVIEAANAYPRLLAGQITAAGKVDPAKLLVIGGGVAGLAAIGCARGLGAIVRAFDTRAAVKEQIESLGAEFLELKFEESGEGAGGYAKTMSEDFLEAERVLFAQQAMEVDIIITTALIPGQEAPKLITQGMVESMREGAVIVDLAAQQGGNCALTQPGELVNYKGKRIIGYTDLPSRMAIQTSWLYGMTIVNFLEEMGGAQRFDVDLENEVVRGALVLHNGEKTWPPPVIEAPPPKQAEPSQEWSEEEPADAKRAETEPGLWERVKSDLWLLGAGLGVLGIGWNAPDTFLAHFTVFILACVAGWLLVWNVTPALHTPLMSVTNAISGIIIIGGMLQLSGGTLDVAALLGAFAAFIATINIAGGFLVTSRMLAMFRQ